MLMARPAQLRQRGNKLAFEPLGIENRRAALDARRQKVKIVVTVISGRLRHRAILTHLSFAERRGRNRQLRQSREARQSSALFQIIIQILSKMA
jgi:hypothetical protein